MAINIAEDGVYVSRSGSPHTTVARVDAPLLTDVYNVKLVVECGDVTAYLTGRTIEAAIVALAKHPTTRRWIEAVLDTT